MLVIYMVMNPILQSAKNHLKQNPGGSIVVRGQTPALAWDFRCEKVDSRIIFFGGVQTVRPIRIPEKNG